MNGKEDYSALELEVLINYTNLKKLKKELPKTFTRL